MSGATGKDLDALRDKARANDCVHVIIEPGGDVYQLLPWDFRGWHSGGGANNTHIGVEMTEPATIKYTGGASWMETGDGENTKAHVLATYRMEGGSDTDSLTAIMGKAAATAEQIKSYLKKKNPSVAQDRAVLWIAAAWHPCAGTAPQSLRLHG